MTQATGTTAVNDLVGVAEDVEDIIYRLDPMDTWAFSTFKKKNATAIRHDWQQDALASPSSNAKVEGDETSYSAVTPTEMFSNYTQISGKSVRITGTADAVRKYGRDEEFAYQIAKKGKELKRDIETDILSSNASVAGNDSTARKSAGFGAQVFRNKSAGAGSTEVLGIYTGGLFAGVTTVGVAGGALDEALLKTALGQAWADGGDPSNIVCGTFQKAKMATFAGAQKFAGVYNQTSRSAQGMVIGGIDLYISDFGEHKIRLSRYIDAKLVYCVDPEYVSLAWLRPIKYYPRAVTGDNQNGEILGEWTTVVDNIDAHAQIRSLATS